MTGAETRADDAGTGDAATTTGDQDATPGGGKSGRRNRLATFALAVTVVLGTALLLWGGDFLARVGAESLLARNIQAATGAAARPQVHVRGLFFLPQVVRGRYDRVDITIEGLESGPLRIDRLDTELTGVHLSFHDVLVQNSVPVPIEETVEHATLTYDDLNHYLKATGRPLTVESAPDGEARLTGTIKILGQTVSASTRAALGAQDGALSVRPTQLDTATPLDRASELLLSQRFRFLVPLDPLPFGQQVSTIQPTAQGIRVIAGGVNVVVRP